MAKPSVVCLMGPTAAGKTGLAVELAQQHNYAIVSVDSALVYKGMDIGTAKPDKQTLARAPHRLIDIIDPLEAYSAADFVIDVVDEIKAILAQGKKPLLVGGTMMYFNALKKGLASMPKASPQLRQELEAEALEFGWEHLHKELQRVDPTSAARIHPNDPQRLQRALEVYRLSGQSMTDLWAQQARHELPFELIDIAVMPEERAVLHARIEQRFHAMMAEGFVEEVQGLYQRGDLHIDLPSMRCVGYRQLWPYIEGSCSLDEAIFKGIVATRQLAKRQITWLRGWEGLEVFDSLSKDLSGQTLKYIQSRII